MSYPNPTTLDLHGKRLEEAIYEVTIFLERIRRAVAASSRGRSLTGRNILFVQIITGSGSHSSHGPVLRNAVQRLLDKRGMDFRLERGGGAFQVDALSGHDLFDPGPAVCSKVVVTEQTEFHQMATARRNNVGASFAHAAAMAPRDPPTQQHANPRPPRIVPPRIVSIPREVSVPNVSQNSPLVRPPNNIAQNTRPSSAPSATTATLPNSSSGDDGENENTVSSGIEPLPSQVAQEDAAVRIAKQLSISENQQRRNNQDHLSREYERQYQRAVSESQLPLNRDSGESKETTEEEKALLKLAYERSIIDENRRQLLMETQNEGAIKSNSDESKAKDEETLLKLASERSILDEQHRVQLTEKQFEETLLLAIEQSIEQITQEEKNTDEVREKQFEDALMLAIEQSIEQSTEEEKNNAVSEEDLIEQALAESKALAEAEEGKMSEDDLLEKVLAESKLEEERRKASAPVGKSSEEETLFEEVMKMSLEQQEAEATAEEEAIKKAIEMSKQIR